MMHLGLLRPANGFRSFKPNFEQAEQRGICRLSAINAQGNSMFSAIICTNSARDYYLFDSPKMLYFLILQDFEGDREAFSNRP